MARCGTADIYARFDARNFALIDVPPVDRPLGGMDVG